jgi:hypothetical protein
MSSSQVYAAKKLAKCVEAIYRDLPRRVLQRVIELYMKGEEVTYYRLLEKEHLSKSKSGLQLAVNTLIECGYIECREGRAKTNSPRGKKLLYPTPLGLLVNSIVSAPTVPIELEQPSPSKPLESSVDAGSRGLYELVLRANRVIDVGERNIVMAARDYGRGKPRFVINLPTTRNDLWEYLWRNKITVKVFIEIPSSSRQVAEKQ